jgi:hypothetical protein
VFFSQFLSSAAVLLHTAETLLTIADPRSHANPLHCLTALPQTLNRGFEPVNNFAASDTAISPVFRSAAHKKGEKRGKKASFSHLFALNFHFFFREKQ